ncbi:MAG: 3-deoxy-D-manno-octulosonic acid transferase [Bacteroidales bacterium]|nr:3-deoxy-D-manno-octulosonic acid transferase [Bacteroidales bacterium]
MRLIYTIGILFYGFGVRVAALFGGKAKQMTRGWRESTHIEPSDKPTAWFHASSLGEFEQARPVIELFRKLNPDWLVVLTFFSPSGYEVRHNYDGADVVRYLPLDTPGNARQMVAAINPEVALFVKYDFWFNHLGELRRNRVPTYLFSAIFRPSQYFFKPCGSWYRKQLAICYRHIFVQNEASLALLQSFGISNTTVAGDTRFDRVADIAAKSAEFPNVAELSSVWGRVIVAGSTWEPDEERLKRFVDRYPHSIGLVLAPHVVNQQHLQYIEQLFGPENCVRFSELGDKPVQGSCKVLIIDCIGLLSALYRYADVAYIGGGWGKGIHNLLEAVTWGKPVVFGPNYGKFKEAHDLISGGGGFSYDTDEALYAHLAGLLDNEQAWAEASRFCKAYVEGNIGSSAMVIKKIEEDIL